MNVQGYGLKIALPSGWYGRVSQRSSQDATVLQAASVPLAAGDETGESTQSSMRGGDVYIKVIDIGAPPPNLLERDPAWSALSGPVTIRRFDLSPNFEAVSLPAYGMRSLVINGRAIMLFVGFGSDPADAQLAQANAVLASLTVASGPAG